MVFSNRHVLLFVTAEAPKRVVDENGNAYLFQYGAIYDASGNIITEAHRTNGIRGDLVFSQNPNKLTFKERLKICYKAIKNFNIFFDAIYMGPWFGHFGHFITETISRFSKDVKKSNGSYIFHTFDLDKNYRKYLEFQKRALDILDLDINKVQIVVDKPAVLIFSKYSTENVALNKSANDEAIEIWNTMSSRVYKNFNGTKIFLSRALLDNSRLKIPKELNDKIEKFFLQHGFTIISPETLDLNNQINILKNCKVLAGLGGSALHLSIFARQSTLIIEIVDEDSPNEGNPHQVVLTSAKKQKHEFVKFLRGDQIDWEKLQNILNQI